MALEDEGISVTISGTLYHRGPVPADHSGSTPEQAEVRGPDSGVSPDRQHAGNRAGKASQGIGAVDPKVSGKHNLLRFAQT